MRRLYFYYFAMLWLLVLYIAIVYYQVNLQVLMDYNSYYASATALSQKINPYQILSATMLDGNKILPTNLNPPLAIWIVQPILYLPYTLSLLLWDALSILAGVQSARLVYKYFVHQFYPSKLGFWIIYFSLFPVIMNFTIGQVGSFIAFFFFQGYHHFLKGEHIRSGLYWGTISALKLFPLLLLFYATMQKQIRIVLTLFTSFILLSFLPLLQTDISTYYSYASLVKKVFWYGDSWNASFYGYLFRVLFDCTERFQNTSWLEMLYVVLLFLGCIVYICIYQMNNHLRYDPSKGYLLTVTTMLLLSPIAWLYYFQLLLPQAFMVYRDLNSNSTSITRKYLGTACLCLLLFPKMYISATKSPNSVASLTIFSIHFYGLLLLFILQIMPPGTNSTKDNQSYYVLNQLIYLMVFLGSFVTYFCIIKIML